MKAEKSVPLSSDFVPGPFDVICARGRTSSKHPGNHRFKSIVQSHLSAYSNAKSRMEKSIIVSKIVDSVQDKNPGGGFVKPEKNQWYQAGESLAREKVGQCLRDLLHSKYQSSTRVKKLRRREGQAKLDEEVNSLLLRSKCVDISSRIKEISQSSEKQSDNDVLKAFNQANMELLQVFKSNRLESEPESQSESAHKPSP